MLLLLLLLLLSPSSSNIIGRRGVNYKRRTTGRGLDRCRPATPTQCGSGNFTSLTVPHFLVTKYRTGGDDCSEYVPDKVADFQLGDVVESASEACAASTDEAVRVCYMRKSDTRSLLSKAKLREDEVDDLDLEGIDMRRFAYKGSCFICERYHHTLKHFKHSNHTKE